MKNLGKSLRIPAAIILAACLPPTGPAHAQAAEALPTLFAPVQPPPSMTGGALMEAARRGDLGSVGALLAGGGDVNGRDERGYTPLMAALDNGEKAPSQVTLPSLSAPVYLAMTRFLLAHGADVNAKSVRGVTPLMLGLANGHPDVVPLLLAHGADVNARTNIGSTPLAYAVTESRRAQDQVSMVGLLLSRGAFPNARDDQGETALSLAAQEGAPDTVRLLLANGADIKGNTQEGMRVIAGAASDGRKEIVEILLADSPSQRPFLTTAALMAAEQQGNDEITKDVIRYVVEQGADVEARNSWGWTPLIDKVYKGQSDMVDFLLTHGADINATDKFGDTALRRSLEWLVSPPKPTDSAHDQELRRIAQHLLEKGADVDIPNTLGRSILFDAVEAGDVNKFEFALSHGANVNRKDREGRTPLFLALFSRHNALARRLLDRGADVNVKDNNGIMPLQVALDALADAVGSGEADVVPDLIARGADVNAPGRLNMPPLETLLWDHPRGVLPSDASAEAKAKQARVDARTFADIRMLIARGADVNNWNNWSGWTLLQTAAYLKEPEAAAMFLKAGAKK